MKTKHYLIVAASVAIGIILGTAISTGIMHKRQMRFMHEGMEYGNFDNSNFGPGQRGMQNANKRGMRKSGNREMNNNAMQSRRMQMKGNQAGMPGKPVMPPMFSQLDLTDDQLEQVEAIFEGNRKKFDQRQELRESRWEATSKEVRDILTDEQRKDYDELMNKLGKKNHAPGLFMALNRYDLTPEQKEKIEVLQKRNNDMQEAMWKGIEQERESTMEQVKSILTEEQKEKMDDLPAFNRKSGRKRT